MSESEANDTGWRGTDQGTQMKSSAEDSPSWNGTNYERFFRFGWWLPVRQWGLHMKASSVISGRLRHMDNAWYRVLNGGALESSRQLRQRIRFFSSLRSGLKTRACGGLDPLILCPFLKPF